MIESSLIKIHGIENLTPEERAHLQDQLIHKRNNFQGKVGQWASNLMNDMDDIADSPEIRNGDNITTSAGMKQDMDEKIREFKKEMLDDDDEDDPKVGVSPINWLEDHYEDKLAYLDDIIIRENLIG